MSRSIVSTPRGRVSALRHTFFDTELVAGVAEELIPVYGWS